MYRPALSPRRHPPSIFQWHEDGAEYLVTCPRCKETLYAPTFKAIQFTYWRHYRTKQCKSHY